MKKPMENNYYLWYLSLGMLDKESYTIRSLLSVGEGYFQNKTKCKKKKSK